MYRAWDTRLERPVALKVLPPDRVGDRSRLERFAREAKSASALAHPHIVTIYEIGRDRVEVGEEPGDHLDVHFIAMELIDGATLRRLIHDERVPLKKLLRHLSQAADGVARAHEAGVVHRDLKPDNVMVTRDGYAKVLDFGLAKLDAGVDPGQDLTSAPTIQNEAIQDEATQEGAVLGTVGYMAPEQVQGRAADHRTDIFAFGCLLYEAATRRRPFVAESSVEVMHRILRDEPQPMEALNPEVPGALRRLVKRCLAKDPERRFQSMKDLALALDDLVEEFDSLAPVSSSEVSGAVAAAAPRPRKRRLPLWLAGLAALAVVATVWWIGRDVDSRPTDAPATPVAPAELRISELTTTSDVGLVAISPDGDYLAQARWQPDGTGLWITHLATGSSVEIVAPEDQLDLRGVTFTPDGNYLVFVRNDPEKHSYSSAFQVPVLGGEPKRLLFDIDSAPSFSPDGQRMAFLRGVPQSGFTNLMVAAADGSDERLLAQTERPDWFELQAPAWSPDGSRIMAIQDIRGGVAETVMSVDVETGRLEDAMRLPEPMTDIDAIAWIPDGSGLVYIGRADVEPAQIWLLELASGSTRRLTTGLSGYESVTVTADGMTIASRHETSRSRLWVAPAEDPNDLRPLTSNRRDYIGAVAVGPEGAVFFQRFDKSGWHIWRTSLDGGTAIQLTREDNWYEPEISADGSLLLAIRRTSAGRSRELWSLDPVTGRMIERLVDSATNVWGTAVAPDASWIAVDVDDGELWAHPLPDGEPRRLADHLNGGPFVSRDGSTLAYIGFRTDADGIGSQYVELISPQGEPLGGLPVGRIHDADGAFAAFSPDGNGFTAHQYLDAVTNLWHLPADGSDWIQLTDFDHGLEGYIRDVAWSPDGEWLVVVKGEYLSDAVLIEGFR